MKTACAVKDCVHEAAGTSKRLCLEHLEQFFLDMAFEVRPQVHVWLRHMAGVNAAARAKGTYPPGGDR